MRSPYTITDSLNSTSTRISFYQLLKLLPFSILFFQSPLLVPGFQHKSHQCHKHAKLYRQTHFLDCLSVCDNHWHFFLLHTTRQSQMPLLKTKVCHFCDVCCYFLKEGINPLFTFPSPSILRMLRHFKPNTPAKRTFMGSMLQDTELGKVFHV